MRRAARTVRRLFRMTGSSGIDSIAQDLGVPVVAVRARDDGGTIRVLGEFRPDIMCIAGYPWILPRTVYEVPRLGAINLHPSLLPRHRGRLPLFWIYYHDDRETGVTVHWVTENVDAGDIILQDGFPLPRGFSVEALGDRIARRGATALRHALDAIESGTDRRVPQEDTLATGAPMIEPGKMYADFAQWDVERVWHFLAGLVTRFQEPLFDDTGVAVSYNRVTGFRHVDHDRVPGSVQCLGSRIELFCRGGIVDLECTSSGRSRLGR